MGFDGGPSMLAKFITILLAFGLNCLERKTILSVLMISKSTFHKQLKEFICVFLFPVTG